MPQVSNLSIRRVYRTIMFRLDAICRSMADTVTEESQWQLPVEERAEPLHGEQFGCRNQDRTVPSGELYICTRDDKLDYRSAWEV